MIVLISILIAAGLCAALIALLFPLMRRYALARPNARSSHRVPTPQGGGIAVLAAMLIVSAGGLALAGSADARWGAFAALAAATGALALIGALDDIQPMPVAPRLAVQAIAVAGLVASAGAGARILAPEIPLAVELALATLAGLWFVNLTNFMDGLDWLTVAAVVPASAVIAGLGLWGVVGPLETLVAAALAGALLGFAPYNKPTARLFLGDVGSLPIGLSLAWLFYALAAQGHVIAAVILPLYSCTDATLTLARRALRRERVLEAHRTHFYQRATDNGRSALEVSTTILVLNVALAGLALLAIVAESGLVDALALVLAAILVALTLARFARPALRMGEAR
ncbi:glycosyl transferase [Salinarimonas ramus]|uniref:Glycosyl transferase n=1 Tax=Salinarimonas ramus TaxID=690164 RepID=A0A917Q439_9HYPH|nr:glycosyl transferase [Salinarimonas ramus]GGK20305.1 glycosyl transferase [Salinarimonas ramus]